MKRWKRPSVWKRKEDLVAESIHLVVWTLAQKLLDIENLEWVHLRLAEDRSFTVWPGHAPLLAETAADALDYRDGSATHSIDLPAGIVQVERDTVTVFLAALLGEQAWSEREPTMQYDRLAQTMLAALERESSTPVGSEPGRQ